MNTWGSKGKLASLVVLVALASTVFIFAGSKNASRLAPTTAQKKSGPAVLHASSKSNAQWNSAYANLPLRFEENQGQTAEQVRFVSRGAGYQLFLTSQEAVLALRRFGPHDLSPRHRAKTLRALRRAHRAQTTTALRMQFEGANPSAQIVGEDQLVGSVNYFVGNNPRNWRSGVPTYSRVKYAGIYPGVDLIYYGNNRRLEYDLVVAPGANPDSIALNLQGARSLHINKDGNLTVKVDGGEVELQKPVVYQNIQGQKKLIDAKYAINGSHRVTFAVANYDRTQPLILDPVLNYSTYLGGSGDDQAWAVAVDSNNNAIVVGNTFSTDFPVTAGTVTTDPENSNVNGAAFVTKISSDGTTELYSSYLSGTSDLGDYAFGVAVDATNLIYVTGQTFSTDFPTKTGAFKETLPSNDFGTSYLTKLDPTLSGAASLLYSSYVGGTNGDYGDAVAVNGAGNAYVSGVSFSSPTPSPFSTATNFPVLNSFQNTLNSADGNAYVTRIDTTQSGNASLIYSTYIGGSGDNAQNANSTGTGEEAFGIAVDSSNNAYLVGTTTSTDFPASTANGGPNNGFQLVAPASIVNGTVFFAKINTAATGAASLTYATYLGGNSTVTGDFGASVSLGPNNVAYLAGSTSSTAFPTTTGAFQTTGNANGLAFISLIDTASSGGASLKYATVIGGTGGTIGAGIRADSAGNAYLTGGTASTDFPTTVGAFQTALTVGAPGAGYIAKLNPAGGGSTDLLYSTYFGGAGSGGNSDQATAIAIDAASPANAYIAGQTFSSETSFPVTVGALQEALNGFSDAFVAKLTLIPSFVVSPSSLNFGGQLVASASAEQTVTVTNNNSTAVTFASIAIVVGTPPASATDFAKTSDTCGTTVAAGATCTVGVKFTPSAAGAESATLVFTDTDLSSPQVVTLAGSGETTAPDFAVTAPATATVTQGGTTTFTVTVTPSNNFNQSVALACTGAPAESTCTIAPSSVAAADGTTAQTATATVTTTAPHAAMLLTPPSISHRTPPTTYMLRIVPLFLAFIMFLLFRSTQSARARLITVAAMFLFVGVAGCSSSSNNGGGGGGTTGGTPKGNATLTVTGTSGSLTHSATVTLTVN